MSKKIVYAAMVITALFCSCARARIEIVKNGEAAARIVVNTADPVDLQAAELLQDFAGRITGAKPEIIPAQSAADGPANSLIQKGDILIGNFQLPVDGISPAAITEDGFALTTNDGYIRIVRGPGKGSIYGVVTLLEDYFGIHYFAENTYTIHKDNNMRIPAGIKRVENPSFRHRQTHSYSMKDPVYKIWHRLEEPNETFIRDMWVHTFSQLLPAEEYGETHPEYYAYINGERRPGNASQWCLTNPEVFEVVAARLDALFKDNPDRHIISVSQNDNLLYCQCGECKAVDEYEGSLSGNIIRFVNKLAERFPDKEISTLAYMYSMPPPRYTKPLPNVNIMLCNINCTREVPLTDNDSGRAFVKALEGWTAISDNIFVWDYGINFDNYLSPFPNFHILQPNMELFYRNNVTMHFHQANGTKGSDFSELRTYLTTKLMWNVSVDLDAVMKTFLNEYYGKTAATHLYKYIKLREKALIESKQPLWIYDTPVSFKDGMLNKPMMKKYNELFDKAEQAAADNETFLNRVREARLPVIYAELEIARTEPDKNIEELTVKLNLFRERAAEYNVTELDERGTKVEYYYDIYSRRALAVPGESLSRGCPVTYLQPAHSRYASTADKALTDGLYGGSSFNEGWVGWEGTDGEFIIDLGEEKEIQNVEVDFLHLLGQWIFLPKSVTCSVSTDNVTFVPLGHKDIAEDRDGKIKYISVSIPSDGTLTGRYIKLQIETIGLCPSWHHGVGFPAWFFVDEVSVY